MEEKDLTDIEILEERIKRLEKLLKLERWRKRQWEKAAEEWMELHEKLKEKYEPEILVTQDSLE